MEDIEDMFKNDGELEKRPTKSKVMRTRKEKKDFEVADSSLPGK